MQIYCILAAGHCEVIRIQTDLHLEEAEGFSVYEQDNHYESKGHICAQNA